MSKIWKWVTSKVHEWFSLDYRSLALLRMGIALTLIFDLIQRAEDLSVFYSDQGVLPRSELLRLWDNQWWISLHMASGLSSFEAILFVIAGIFAVMLLVGYRTEVAIVASWFLLVSIHARNPVILQGGDVVLRVAMFWMMFLPLGRAWSLDRLFNRVPAPKERKIISAATIAYIIQVCLLYIFTGILKNGDTWHNGTAVYYALNVDQLITPTGAFLREFPSLMTILTYTTLYVETYGTLLFFSPVATSFFRTFGILIFAFLQIGFNSTMRLGLFGMIAIVITLGLLPSDFWDTAYARFVSWLSQKGKTGLSIYYDYGCSFCAKVSILLKRILLLHPETRVLPATSDPAVEKLMLSQDSWVIIDKKGITHTSWDGVVTVAAYSPLFFWAAPLLRMSTVQWFGEKLYRRIAQKRKQVCISEPEEKPLTRLIRVKNIIVTMLVLMLITYSVCWNIDTLGNPKKIITPNLEWIGWLTRLDQKFNMFAPTPLTEDGWYVFPGQLRDGTQVDVFSGTSPVSYIKPQWVAYTYKNQRWQKYLMNLWSKDFSEYRLSYGRYLCRQWNDSHSQNKQLMTFNMIFMEEDTPPPGMPQTPVKPVTIWNHHCF